ncbi:hypothetical protein Asi03nite_58720 [Actinoplanes siamensis]|uniref:Uncharacterized protein n=1 Tax=Actinoplanes siamensis TaxID=1223317 RepID=A0A919TN61_9ACTN|nr:hypothetical protein Asi03nite_58720 [Actinoplanes siamensis]
MSGILFGARPGRDPPGLILEAAGDGDGRAGARFRGDADGSIGSGELGQSRLVPALNPNVL